MGNFTIAIDCDDAATALKAVLVAHIKAKGYEIEDLNYQPTHPGSFYADVGFHLAEQIRAGKYERGILLCGTGLGVAMSACKVEGVYAGVCHDVYSAQRLCMSNDAQVIAMGARVIGPELAKTVIDAWLTSEFAGGASAEKVERMRALEKESFHR